MHSLLFDLMWFKKILIHRFPSNLILITFFKNLPLKFIVFEVNTITIFSICSFQFYIINLLNDDFKPVLAFILFWYYLLNHTSLSRLPRGSIFPFGILPLAISLVIYSLIRVCVCVCVLGEIKHNKCQTVNWLLVGKLIKMHSRKKVRRLIKLSLSSLCLSVICSLPFSWTCYWSSF